MAGIGHMRPILEGIRDRIIWDHERDDVFVRYEIPMDGRIDDLMGFEQFTHGGAEHIQTRIHFFIHPWRDRNLIEINQPLNGGWNPALRERDGLGLCDDQRGLIGNGWIGHKGFE